MSVNGIVYDGSPATVDDWCKRHVGPGRFHYQWTGMDWLVTVATANGHERLRFGDAVIQVAADTLGIVRKGQS